jgi:hypothetical protein
LCLFSRKSDDLLRRMYTVLLQGGILWRLLSGPLDHLDVGFLCWLFCLDDQTIGNTGVLMLPWWWYRVCKSFSVWVHWHWVHTGWQLVPLDVLLFLLVWSDLLRLFWLMWFWSSLWYKYCYFCLFSGSIHVVNLLPAFHPNPVWHWACEVIIANLQF